LAATTKRTTRRVGFVARTRPASRAFATTEDDRARELGGSCARREESAAREEREEPDEYEEPDERRLLRRCATPHVHAAASGSPSKPTSHATEELRRTRPAVSNIA
jgi:hypothetical protein